VLHRRPLITPKTTVNLTADQLHQKTLLKTGALQNAILTSASFSIIATDEKGIIQIFNIGAEAMLGYKASEVINSFSPSEMYDPSEVKLRATTLSEEMQTPVEPGFQALSFKASRGIEDIYEVTHVRKDLSRFPGIVSVTALRDNLDKIIGYLLIGTDNSARKRVEVDLQKAMEEAERANQAKSDFLSSMSHELRTPLNAILGFAQLIENGTPPPTPAQKRSIDQILGAGWYLLDLINEILDLALIESGKLPIALETILLNDAVRECQLMIQPQAQTRNIQMIFSELNAPCYVVADPMRLKQVLINLLSNAIKYNNQGGSVHISYETDKPGSIRICIRDTGDGISKDKLTQVFEPFNRLGKEAGVEEGTGIGLVVSKQLIKLMNGEIGVESTVGHGSMFWIELKRNTGPRFSSGIEHEPVEVPEAVHAEVLRTVLYVEDNPANLMLVEDLMARRNDIHLLSAKDGIGGVEMSRRFLPDVILMDINLPGISGVQAMKILREDPATAHIPVIALSANAIPRDIERGLEAGFFRYLTKPIKVNEFMSSLDEVLALVALKSARKSGES